RRPADLSPDAYLIRDTVSRQLGSALRAWLRKPQRVVAGLNSLSRYLTPCSLSGSRMLDSLKDSEKGSPWSRAKRARISCRLVIYGFKIFLIGVTRSRGKARRAQPGQTEAQARITSHLHRTRPGLATLVVRNFTRDKALRLCLRHSSITPKRARPQLL